MRAKRQDGLTGFSNREALELELKQLLQREDNVALALLDIDHFKEVNDNFGHEAGDLVLQTVSAIMGESGAGRLFRVSGDEFAVVMPGVTLEQAFLKMETLRLAVYNSQNRFPAECQGSSEITVTLGVAQYPRDAKDEPALMRAADAALSSAKEAGKNQVALAPNEDMVMKTCYYPTSMLRKLRLLADKAKKKESHLLREALNDLLRKYDRVEENGV